MRQAVRTCGASASRAASPWVARLALGRRPRARDLPGRRVPLVVRAPLGQQPGGAFRVVPVIGPCWPWSCCPPPALPSSMGSLGGRAESPGGGFSWDRGFGAQAAPSKDDPSFDYPLPPQHAGGDRGGSTWPPPGYSSYPGPAAPAYGGLQVDVEDPSYVRGRGSVTDRPAGQGPWSGQGQQGYRFRGDEAPGDQCLAGVALCSRIPVSSADRGEQDRSGATDGWRPHRAERGQACQNRSVHPMPSVIGQTHGSASIMGIAPDVSGCTGCSGARCGAGSCLLFEQPIFGGSRAYDEVRL